ncbi:MAG TPA: hypothetical protein VMG38_26115 [Trebonia sp.]|nr:hypothetical protein [Trebonia sp.]
MGPVSLLTDPRLFESWLSQHRTLSSPDDAQASVGAEMFLLIADGARSEPDDVGRLKAQTDAARRRQRRDLSAAVEGAMPQSPFPVRLALLALVLIAVEGGTWRGSSGDSGWMKVVATALENLDRDDIPASLSEPLASWAALATYQLYDRRLVSGNAADTVWYDKAVAAVAHLFPDASPALVTRYAAMFTNRNGGLVDPEAVLHVAELAVQDDPLADAVDALASRHPDWDVHKHSATLLHLDLGSAATLSRAAEALDAIPDMPGPVAVLATGVTAAWTIAIRQDGTLIHVERSAQGAISWRQYKLSPLTGPTRIGRDPDAATRSRVNHGPLQAPFPAALEALAATGFDLSADPPSPCPYE